MKKSVLPSLPEHFSNAEVVHVKARELSDFSKVFGIMSGSILTRPDGYVGYIEAKGRKSKLEEYLLRVIQRPVRK